MSKNQKPREFKVHIALDTIHMTASVSGLNKPVANETIPVREVIPGHIPPEVRQAYEALNKFLARKDCYEEGLAARDALKALHPGLKAEVQK